MPSQRSTRPILLERGKDVSARRFDLAPIFKHGRILEDSNYAFGEGGAGTFSDGKLYTRATKRGPVAKVYQTLFEHGAPEEILVDAHPHIGSNLLPNVVRNMRQSIQLAGGEVHFETKVVDFLLKNQTIQGVVCSNGKSFESRHLILATGHSARDIYRLLNDRQIRQDFKYSPWAMRLEHPQPLVDRHQYHLKGDQPRPDYLPAASYRLATKIKNRGVHSFCMCPGGIHCPSCHGKPPGSGQRDEPFQKGFSLRQQWYGRHRGTRGYDQGQPFPLHSCWNAPSGVTGNGGQKTRRRRTKSACSTRDRLFKCQNFNPFTFHQLPAGGRKSRSS